jgi:hypothetical protein
MRLFLTIIFPLLSCLPRYTIDVFLLRLDEPNGHRILQASAFEGRTAGLFIIHNLWDTHEISMRAIGRWTVGNNA